MRRNLDYMQYSKDGQHKPMQGTRGRNSYFLHLGFSGAPEERGDPERKHQCISATDPGAVHFPRLQERQGYIRRSIESEITELGAPRKENSDWRCVRIIVTL